MLKRSLLFVALAALLAIPLASTAQDQSDLVPVTLEELTANPEPFYGQTVILEGVLAEFVNVKTIVLGEGAAIDDDRVLVVNTSGRALPVNLFRDDRIVITGVVHPALQTRVDNGEVVLPEDRVAYRRDWVPADMMDGDMTDMDGTADDMATPEGTTEDMATPEGTSDDSDNMAGDDNMSGDMTMAGDAWDSFDFYYGGGFPDAYDGFLVIEVTSVDDVTHMVEE